MHSAQLNKRLDKLEPHGDKFDHLTDEELKDRLSELNRLLLKDVGSGEPDIGYQLFKQWCDIELPNSLKEYHASNSAEHFGLLNRFLIDTHQDAGTPAL